MLHTCSTTAASCPLQTDSLCYDPQSCSVPAGLAHFNLILISEQLLRTSPISLNHVAMGFIGIGVDVVYLPRIVSFIKRRTARRLASRILSNDELAAWDSIPPRDDLRRTRFLAVRYVLKGRSLYMIIKPVHAQVECERSCIQGAVSLGSTNMERINFPWFTAWGEWSKTDTGVSSDFARSCCWNGPRLCQP